MEAGTCCGSGLEILLKDEDGRLSELAGIEMEGFDGEVGFYL